MYPTVSLLSIMIGFNGVFALPDTETSTENEKLTQNPMGICIDVSLSMQYEHLHTILINPLLSVSESSSVYIS